jgi:hypothetical protein
MFSTKVVQWHREGVALEDYPNTAQAHINSGLD